MRRVLEQLSTHAMVIIDAPPLLPVTDGAVLTHQADGALMAISVGKTTYDIAEKAIATLHKAQGRVLGLVLNKAPLKGADAPHYAHAYRGTYLPRTPADAESSSASVSDAILSAAVVADRPAPTSARAVSTNSEELSFEDLLKPAGQAAPPTSKRRARSPQALSRDV
jgi:hypothetical protein